MKLIAKRISTVLMALVMVMAFMPQLPMMQGDAYADNESTVEDFFTGLDGIVEATFPTDYPYSVVDRDGTKWLKSGSPTGNSTKSSIQLKALQAATITLDYQVGAGTCTRAGFEITKGYTTLYNYSDYGSGVTGCNKTKSGSATVDLEEGDVIKISYARGYVYSSDDTGENCVYLKNFKATLPSQVIFHSNYGEDETYQQGIKGSGTLKANSFTRDGYRFKGWAETSDGEIKYQDKGSISITADTHLYAVWAPLYDMTFNVTPEDAAFEVHEVVGESSNKLTPNTGTKYVYTVENGTYIWVATKFGYKDYTDYGIVNGASVTKDVVMEKLPANTVTFSYSGDASTIENGSLEVVTGSEEIAPKEGSDGLVFELPNGYEYTYTFKSSNYAKKTGTINLKDETEAGTKQIEIPLEEKTAWEGADDIIEPQQVEGVYQISSGSELAWVAQETNSGKKINAILTKDIDLGNEPWLIIGNSSWSGPFKGEFNGNGKTIKGLYIDNTKSTTVGLFGYVSDGANIHDLTVEGTVKSTANSSSYATGGMIGQLGYGANTVTNCVNKVNVTGRMVTGGLVGTVYSSGNKVIDGCVNLGNIEGTTMCGGIVGKTDNVVEIKNCYNRGNISGVFANTGGITGYTNSASINIHDCYTTGTITPSEGSTTNVNPAIGNKSSGTVSNVYYLSTLGTDSNATAISETDLKALNFAAGMDAFAKDNKTPINDGYPILTWQVIEGPEHVHELEKIEKVEPTCDTDGKKEHWKCKDAECGKVFEDEEGTIEVTDLDSLVIPASHDWGEVTYTPNDDYTKVTAERICKRDENHKQTETADVTSEVTKPAKCGVKGETTYTSAGFENEAFEVWTQTLEDIDALSHNWSDWELETDPEGSQPGEAVRHCTNEGCTETETMPVIGIEVDVRLNLEEGEPAEEYKSLKVTSIDAYQAGLKTIDNPATVSFADAIAAAHVIKYADNFKAAEEITDDAQLCIVNHPVYGPGFQKAFGVTTSNIGMLINNSKNGIWDAVPEVNDGDLVSLGFFNGIWPDTDRYIYLDKKQYISGEDGNVTIAVNTEVDDENWVGQKTPVSGATVVLQDENGNVAATAKTDDKGVAVLRAGRAGEYTAVVTETPYNYSWLPPVADATVDKFNALTDAEAAIKAAEDANKEAAAAAAKAEESKKAAEEAAKTPGQSAVDAAKKAKADADDAAKKAEAAKAAADKAKDAAKKAVELAKTDEEKARASAAASAANKAGETADKTKAAADKAAADAKNALDSAEKEKAKADENAEVRKDIDSRTPSDTTLNEAKTDKKLSIKASSITTSAKTGKKTMTVTWKKVAGATNYRIAYKKAGAKKWTYKWSAGKNSVVLTKMKNKGLYEFKLQAVKKSGNTWTKSALSKSNYRYYAITKQTVKAGNKAVTVKAKKTAGATGYQVLYSTKKNMAGAKIKYGKKPTVKVSKLKKGTRYYVQVRPVKKYKGKTYVGILSAKKAVKAK